MIIRIYWIMRQSRVLLGEKRTMETLRNLYIYGIISLHQFFLNLTASKKRYICIFFPLTMYLKRDIFIL